MIEDNTKRQGVLAAGIKEAKKRPINSYPVYKLKEPETENEYSKVIAQVRADKD